MSSIKCITLEEEIKKNPELKVSDIQILRKWSEKQPHLPKIQDVQLALFLHSSYYQIERTKEIIENYYTYRTHMPEFFSNRDILKVERVRKTFDIIPTVNLEKRTKEDYLISMGKFLDFESSHYDFNDMAKVGFMALDQFTWTHGSIPGFIFIVDATGVSFGHAKRINLMSLKKYIYYLQDALPMRLMAIHVLNMTPMVELIFNMMKPFMKKELLQLAYFHPSLERASKYFPIDALPNENGGKAGPFRDILKEHIKNMENFRQSFQEDEKFNRVNESLRIAKSNVSNDLFGTEGSFRKIEID